MTHDEPLSVAVAKHQHVAGGSLHRLSIPDVRECVVAVFTATSPYTRTFCSPKETLAFGRVPASLKYSAIAAGVGATFFAEVPTARRLRHESRDARWDSTVVCGAPS